MRRLVITLALLSLLLTGCAITQYSQSAESPNKTKVQKSSLYIVNGDFATSIHSKQTTYPWGLVLRESYLCLAANFCAPATEMPARPIPKAGRRQTSFMY